MAIEVFAPAKINLALHVTGRRADGYHLLDSLVVFASIGDRVTVTHSDRLALEITGPEAGGLTGGADNLVLKAARFFDPGCTVRITLVKNLPVASGIGGGSADAAATIKALAELYDRPIPEPADTACLGADVPACMMGRPLRLRGVGEGLSEVPGLPAIDIVLVNPRIGLATPRVFAQLTSRSNPPLEGRLPQWADPQAFCDWLGETRNDLLAPATRLVPEIALVLASIRDTGCLFAGMSGSGGTCFGLYPPDGGAAKSARDRVHAQHPEWWCQNGSFA